MKKLHKHIITFFLLIVCCGFINQTAAQEVRLRVNSVNVNEKDTFQMVISSDSLLTGKGIYAYKLALNYNQSALEFIGVAGVAATLESWGEPVVNSSKAGELLLTGAGATPMSGSGDLIYLRFYAKAPYTTNISWNLGKSMLNEGNPTLLVTNGTAYITALPKPLIYPSSSTLFVGETVNISGYNGVAPYTFISPNPNIISIEENSKAKGVAPGKTKLQVIDSQGNTELSTGDYEVRGVRLSVVPKTVEPQDTFLLDLKIEVGQGVQVFSGDFTIRLPEILDGVSSLVQAGDFPVSIESKVTNKDIKVSFATATPITGEGIICRLGLVSLSPGHDYVQIQQALFNENLASLTTNKAVEVVCKPTVAPTGLLPETGVVNQERNITFYWQPSLNAKYYQFYLWEDGADMPSSPYRNYIYSPNFAVNNLKVGTTYNWKVAATNECSNEHSEIHQFTVKNLPDLEVVDIIVPAEIQSGGEFDVTFTIKNTGQEYTGGKAWRDAVYISTDSAANSSKTQLMAKYNLKQLQPDDSYTQTYTITIPAEYDGDYYIFVQTDINNNIVEVNENNNQLRATNAVKVWLKPFPDILVKNINANVGTIYPSDSLLVHWDVENIGDGDAIGGWRERVTLVPENGGRLTLGSYIAANIDLPAGQQVRRQQRFKIPDIVKFSGKAKIEVYLSPNTELKEYQGTDANNTELSLDDFTVEDRLFLTIGTTSLSEGSTADVRCVLTRSGSISNDLLVNLSVSLADQITIPATVVIGANTSSATFNLKAIDNNIVDGTRFITVSAEATDYQSAAANLQILDNEATVLVASMDKYIAYEGDTLHLTISRNLVTNTAVVVNLSTNRTNQWRFNNAATILPNEASVTVPIIISEDNVPELTENVSLKISSGGYASDEVFVTIIDNDVPEIDLLLSVDTISEGGGIYAAYGTIVRLEGDGIIQVNFSASQNNALILPSSVTLPAKARSIQFNIGVVDNTEMDGYRAVDITGSVYLKSCYCASNAESGGVVTKTIVIADNDGPSLSAKVTPAALLEGKENAGKLIITRNTEPTTALTVNISHNDPTEISLPTSVVMAVGEKSIEVPITTIDDGVEDGDQLVTITVSATNYTSGFCTVYVTDSNKPDFVLKNVSLSRYNISSNDTLTVRGWLHNEGYLNAPTGSKVAVYLSKDMQLNESTDEKLAEFKTEGQLLKSDSIPFSLKLKLGKHTGEYYLFVHANPLNQVNELIYNNNTYQPILLDISAEYSATAQVDITQTLQNTPITIYGQALNSSNQPVPNAEVDVYLMNNGTRKVLEARTNEQGSYSIEFNPLTGESGHYGVGACFPGQKTNVAQDNFDILGVVRTSTAYITWLTKTNEPFSGSIQIKNTSNIPLKNIRLVGENLPEGCSISSVPMPNLTGNATSVLYYSVLGTEQSSGKDYQKLNINIVSDEGVSEGFTAYYFCQEQKATLATNVSAINTTVIKDGAKFIEFTLMNQGGGESGKISIDVPKTSYLTLVSSDTISNLKTGEGATVTLKLTDDGLPLHTPASGRIAFNCANGKGTTLNYKVEAVSNAKGVVKIDVVDEYTYNTAEAPHVKDAHITLKHPFSGNIVAEGFTGSDGIFLTDSIPEGYYTMTIQAEKHEGYRNNLYVEASKTVEQAIFLSFQAITYTWEVVRTEIEDEYDIDLILTFETNVPAPVVLMEGPTTLPDLKNDETFPFLLTLTNKGLITANNVDLTLPEDPEYEFITPYKTMNLLAQQSIQIPVVMKRKAGYSPSDAPPKQNTVQSTLNCQYIPTAGYAYECGPHTQYKNVRVSMTYMKRVCTGGGGGGGYYTPSEPSLGWDSDAEFKSSSSESTVSVNKVTDCDNCVESMSLAAIGCIPGPIGMVASGLSCVTSLDFSSAWSSLKTSVECVVGFVPIYGCIYGVGSSAYGCYRGMSSRFSGSSPSPVKQFAPLATTDKPLVPMPPVMAQAMEDLTYFVENAQNEFAWFEEITGIQNIHERVNFIDFFDVFGLFLENRVKLTATDLQLAKDKLAGTDFSVQEIENFVTRWNNTMDAHAANVYVPNAEFPNIINNANLEACALVADSVQQYAVGRGYDNILQMGDLAYGALKEELDGGKSAVCASITIKISQKLTMTREAFEGTLTVENGHQEVAMKNIKLNLEVRNQQGIICNDLFQINTKALSVLTGIDGTGELAATKKGTATILFIPTKNAAPELPTSYSFGGSFSYIDPFNGLEVTKQLFPVTLDVSPSPDLFLHYFMQRDVYGDDPMTEDIIEPVIPAELALMIQNDGFGAATKVKVESAQPEIVENQKGLAIKLALIGSNLNGKERQLGINNIEFGNIPPKSTAIGQWWFTSNLLGHFTHYETRVVHANSFGNPELSLISGSALHELIKSIRVYNPDDGINDFLVNEIQDAEEMPDAIYTSQGDVLDVYPAKNISFNGSLNASNMELELKVEPKFPGWNYGRLDAVGGGTYKVDSVIRIADNFVLPKDNVWQTHVTLPDGEAPIYEYKFHFVDEFSSLDEVKYRVTYLPDNIKRPAILRIEGVPTSLSSTAVNTVRVIFESPIDATTFTTDVMTLYCQAGPNLITNAVLINQVDDTTFDIDLSQVTVQDGYYVLTIATTEIANEFGDKGYYGKQVSWSQYTNTPAVLSFIGLPEEGKPNAQAIDNVLVQFNLPIDVETFTPARVIWTLNGTAIAINTQITPMNEEMTLFRLSGLEALISTDGEYALTIDLLNIKAESGNFGLMNQTAKWLYDTTPPQIKEVRLLKNGGFDEQHVTTVEVVFTEAVDGFSLPMIELERDGNTEPISQLIFAQLNDSTYQMTNFNLLTYHEAEYALNFDLSYMVDMAGNIGVGTYEKAWVVNRTAPPAVTELKIAPDYGHAADDGITSTGKLNVSMRVHASNARIKLYYNSLGSTHLLVDTLPQQTGLFTIPVNIPIAGSMKLQAETVDQFGNSSVAEINIYIDDMPLSASWEGMPTDVKRTHPQTVLLNFSDKLLTDADLLSQITCRLNNEVVALSGLTITQNSETQYALSGFGYTGVEQGGVFSVSVNTTALSKYSSGKAGIESYRAQWTLRGNKPPVAVVGEDMHNIERGMLITLDGSASYDDDMDEISYLWTAPEGIELSSNIIAKPMFVVPEESPDTLIFKLIVSDGVSQSQEVSMKVGILKEMGVESIGGHYNAIEVYPNPTRGDFAIRFTDLQTSNMVVRIFNLAGKLVYQEDINLDGTNNQYPIESLSLKPGIYMVDVRDNKTKPVGLQRLIVK